MDKYLTAERGGLYTFNNGKENKRCIIVSSGRRYKDNIVSILFLSTDRGNISDDVVRFKMSDEIMCVRTDLVTYTRRLNLTDKIGQIPEEIMRKIDKGIARSLGLFEI